MSAELEGAGNLLKLTRNPPVERKEKEKADEKAAAAGPVRVDQALEAKLIVQAVRLNTNSKLTFSDSGIFDQLIRAVFTGVDYQDFEYELLSNGLSTLLCFSSLFGFRNVFQLLDCTTVVRMCAMQRWRR